MRSTMIVKATPDSEAGVMPPREAFEAMGEYNDELVKSGVMLAGDGLHPSSKGFKIRFAEGGKTKVVDGPFTESKEPIAGFWIIQVKSREEAVEWARRVPFGPGDELEVRQVFEAEDFPSDILPPEEAAKETAFRDEQIKGAMRADLLENWSATTRRAPSSSARRRSRAMRASASSSSSGRRPYRPADLVAAVTPPSARAPRAEATAASVPTPPAR